MRPLRLPPRHLLACPRCGAGCDAGLDAERQVCGKCQLNFFDLAGMPCWFNVGQAQLRLWQSLYGIALQQAEQNFRREEEGLPLYDLPPRGHERMRQAQAANRQIIEDVKNLLDGVGLVPQIDAEFANYDASRMLQYFELLLRDWAWDAAVPPAENENHLELQRLRRAVAQTGIPLGDTLVLGAGAGRLSWDIQRALHPSCTLALDTNPVLISAAHRLIALRQNWQLTELQPNPQAGFPPLRRWQLAAEPGSEDDHARWFALAANGWSPPLRAGSLDTVITPWFLDVNGREVRALIAQVQKLLKPGGIWLNTGPLLYGTDIPPMRRYTTAEIVELVEFAGFTLEYQDLAVSPYLKTPLSAQLRTEQVWTFAARAPTPDAPGQKAPQRAQPPAWILLTHLPIPQLPIAPPDDPALQQLLKLVDGRRSVNDIAAQLAANLGPDQNPVHLVQTVFMEYLLPQVL